MMHLQRRSATLDDFFASKASGNPEKVKKDCFEDVWNILEYSILGCSCYLKFPGVSSSEPVEHMRDHIFESAQFGKCQLQKI